MKKTMIITLALVFVLGIAGTAFAANPFVDVPANHWAYGAVSKLAKAGIIDGMGDGTYQGQRNMTRYEMAQIVAKAMVKVDKADAANKALIEKLEAEFAAELNNLGVRVSKLEAKVGSIAFSGDARIRYVDDEGKSSTTAQRLRLAMKSQVNEDMSFYGRFMAMNHNEYGTTTNDKAQIIDANFTVKDLFNTGATATVGRFSQKFLTIGHISDTVGMVDGAKVAFGKKVKVGLGYADFAPAAGTATITPATSEVELDGDGMPTGNIITTPAVVADKMEDAFFATVNYNTSKATSISALYLKETTGDRWDIWGLGFKSQLTKDWYVAADYSKNTAVEGDPILYVARLGYKGAKAAKAGTWGAYVEYLKAEAYANPTGLSGASINVDNVKGWNVKYENALAKNVVLEAWQTFNQKNATTGLDNNKDRTRVQINFFF